MPRFFSTCKIGINIDIEAIVLRRTITPAIVVDQSWLADQVSGYSLEAIVGVPVGYGTHSAKFLGREPSISSVLTQDI